MLVVVVDTSTPAVTAALAEVSRDGVTVLAERATVDARAHGEVLAPQLSSCLLDAGVSITSVGAVVAGVGPGPFTGLRVGLVTAASVAQSLGVPTYGVVSLDGLGAAAPGPGPTLVATDARRKEIYWAVYLDGVRLTDPAVGRPADVIASLPPDGGPVRAIGDGALKYADVLGLPVLETPRYPSPSVLVGLAASRILDGAPSEPLTPQYLRRPDATEPHARKPVLT
ncbi:tRNA (adenosine(37)-N6)-threonylcarbamoyltransferase complex dimerization subunit type 1 TsaB [Luedemannella flava]|uniref:tRNA (Adenosine(37)-N6)-threonylcarbamoyltransferase complex dimerization subunit type 1 TsaB n=1 Tax=Luedemannella flava TaxID=349316 RepID=A0ABP4XXZ3_9ACTN